MGDEGQICIVTGHACWFFKFKRGKYDEKRLVNIILHYCISSKCNKRSIYCADGFFSFKTNEHMGYSETQVSDYVQFNRGPQLLHLQRSQWKAECAELLMVCAYTRRIARMTKAGFLYDFADFHRRTRSL